MKASHYEIRFTDLKLQPLPLFPFSKFFLSVMIYYAF